MLTKLPNQAYETVRELFASLRFNLAVDSIIEGLTPAPIYVDRAHNPRLAITWTRSRVFVAGEVPDTDLLDALRQTILSIFYPLCADAGPGAFTLTYTTGWRNALKRALFEQYPCEDTRYYYTLQTPSFANQFELSSDYRIVTIDKALLADQALGNVDVMQDEMRSERSTIEDFLEKSVGVCVLREGVIVGWCMTEYNCGDRCEIGIYTDPQQRQQGVATAAASVLLRQRRMRGIKQVGWHCWQTNEGSKATARRLGFALQQKVPVLFAYTDPLENLAVNGFMALRSGNVEEALNWFEQAVLLGDLPQWSIPFLQEAKQLKEKGKRSDSI